MTNFGLLQSQQIYNAESVPEMKRVSGVSRLHSLVFLNALPKCMQTGVASAAYHLLDQCSPEMQAGYILYSLESEEVGSQQHPRVYSIIVNFVLILHLRI